jgi:hypothetical protein
MPQPKHRNHSPRLFRFALLGLVALAFWALRRERPSPAPNVEETATVPGWASSPAPSAARRRRGLGPRRLAASLAFAAIFFTGASFSAVAGTQVVNLLEDDPQVAQTEAAAPSEAPASEPAPAEAAPAEPVEAPAAETPAPAAKSGRMVEADEPAPAPAVEAPAESAPEVAPAPVEDAVEAPVAPEAAEDDFAPHNPAVINESVAASRPAVSASGKARTGKARTGKARTGKAPAPARPTALDPEANAPNKVATVWLHRVLPDPTPASLRLAPATAKRLRKAGRASRVDWALVLGTLRADGWGSRVPARRATIAETAGRLAGLGARKDAWSAALAVTGRTAAADRAVALARYYRAVGLDALVNGLLAQQDELEAKVLADERVDIYAGGRDDIAAGRIDVRVLALVEYLAESYGQVTVSSLFTGHRLYARPGVVSAHIYGQAVDVSGLDGKSVYGNSQPGGLVEKAVRDILLLPAEMRPRQVISLLGLGGPSFPLANHDDHLHIGY